MTERATKHCNKYNQTKEITEFGARYWTTTKRKYMATADLTKLTREEKIELLLALEEKKKRGLRAKPRYVPNEAQRQVHLDGATYRARFNFAANSSGKTTLGVNECFWTARGYNPVTKQHTKVPARIYVVLDSPQKVEEKFLMEAKKWFDMEDTELRKEGKPYVARIVFKNGSDIIFLFHEADRMKVEGIDSYDFVWFDEPCPKHLYVGMYRGLRGKGTDPRVLFTGTPIGAPWLRTDIYERWAKGELPDTTCYRYGMEVNRANLREGYIEEFSRQLTEQERKVRLEGMFYDLDGLALAGLFKEHIHVVDPIEWDRAWPVVIAIDCHSSKPHTACMVGADRDGYLYYIKEIAERCPAKPFALRLKEWMNGYRVIDIVCDSLGSTTGTGGEGDSTFINVLNQNGVRARATSYEDKNDELFVERIMQVLLIPEQMNNFGQRIPKLRIFRGNKGIVSDITNVEWQRDKGIGGNKPKLNIANTDRLSTLKYALATGISFRKHKAKVLRTKNKSPWAGS